MRLRTADHYARHDFARRSHLASRSSGSEALLDPRPLRRAGGSRTIAPRRLFGAGCARAFPIARAELSPEFLRAGFSEARARMAGHDGRASRTQHEREARTHRTALRNHSVGG